MEFRTRMQMETEFQIVLNPVALQLGRWKIRLRQMAQDLDGRLTLMVNMQLLEHATSQLTVLLIKAWPAFFIAKQMDSGLRKRFFWRQTVSRVMDLEQEFHFQIGLRWSRRQMRNLQRALRTYLKETKQQAIGHLFNKFKQRTLWHRIILATQFQLVTE